MNLLKTHSQYTQNVLSYIVPREENSLAKKRSVDRQLSQILIIHTNNKLPVIRHHILWCNVLINNILLTG